MQRLRLLLRPRLSSVLILAGLGTLLVGGFVILAPWYESEQWQLARGCACAAQCGRAAADLVDARARGRHHHRQVGRNSVTAGAAGGGACYSDPCATASYVPARRPWHPVAPNCRH